MDRKEFWERAEKAINQTFEAAKKSAQQVAQKAGEAAQVTRLLVNKLSLEHRLAKQLTRLGGFVYEKAGREEGAGFVGDPEIRRLVDEAKQFESELAQVEASLEKEMKGRRPVRRKKAK